MVEVESQLSMSLTSEESFGYVLVMDNIDMNFQRVFSGVIAPLHLIILPCLWLVKSN